MLENERSPAIRRNIAVALAAALVAACGAQGLDTTTLPAPPDSEAESVHAAETSLGRVLVDPDGMTLYVFTPDQAGESTCYDSCAALWPPVAGDTAIGSGLDSGLFGTTTRRDGSSQLTVAGRPLYLYAGDSNPGDVNGQGVQGIWFVVGPDGEMIGAEQAAGTTMPATTVPYDDYGY